MLLLRRPLLRSVTAPSSYFKALSAPEAASRRYSTASSTDSGPSTNPSGTTSSSESKTTHFGFQTVPEDEKEALVGGVFASVASSYDLMNDAMSLGIHRLWKDRFVQKLDPRGGIRCLDVAGGTGDIALRILDHAREKHADRRIHCRVLDINAKMLKQGQRRVAKTMYWGGSQVSFSLGNAEDLSSPIPTPPPNPPTSQYPSLISEPIPSSSLDLYTIAFGIRNVTRIDLALKEAHRVLKPGGILGVLEFGKVGLPVLRELYREYSFQVIPLLGHILASDRESYQYLVESIERFPSQPDFAKMIQEAGFALPGSQQWTGLGGEGRGEAWEDLTFGIASIWTGIKL